MLKIFVENFMIRINLMKQLICFLTLIFISQSILYAQATFAELDNKKILYPSPTAAGLGKYGEYPVSLYNGLVNIGQDIVTVKSGRLKLDVSLSYHASGNKPSDIPGWVGLGFSLNAGGVITRIIKDMPDDDTQYGFYFGNSSVQYLWNNAPNTTFVEKYFDRTIDPRSDTYQFNFCGKTGEFMFDWNRKIHFKQQMPFKIEVMAGPMGFAGFKITTDDGTIYTFDQIERSSINFLSISSPASSWYLTKIENLSGDNIILKYSNPSSHFRYKEFGQTKKEVYGSVMGSNLSRGVTLNHATSTDEVIYLDEIVFNEGKLIFGKTTRNDPRFVPAGINPSFAEEKKLDLITLKNNNSEVIKQWKFLYYENSTERLKLKDLIVQGSNQTDVQKYSFSYNLQSLPIPPAGPNPSNPYFSNAVDYWGYYNGAGANGEDRTPKLFIPEHNQYFGSANRMITPSLVKAEILEKITYPTGGYTSFEYESNDYSQQGDSYAVAQNPMFYSSGSSESYEFTYNRDEGGFETDPVTVSFTLTEPGTIHIQYTYGADGPVQGWPTPGSYDYTYQLSAGTRTLADIFNQNLLTFPINGNITKIHGWVTINHNGPMIPYDAKVGPGLRIKSITTNDGITSRTKSFEYKLGGSQNTAVSSGFLSVFPAYYVLLQNLFGNAQGFYITSDPINDTGDGPPIGYSRVVERFQDSSFIVHNYTSYSGYPDEMMTFTNGFSSPKLAHMSSMEFQRGLEFKTDYYNTEEILQKEIINSYAVLPESVTDVQCIELKPTFGIVFGGSDVNYVQGTLSSLYYLRSCFLYNNAKTETVFDKDGLNPVSTVVYKSYDNVKHLQPTQISTGTSGGNSLISISMTYPEDYASGVPFIDYMKEKHLLSYPIERVTYKGYGDVFNVIDGSIITYKAEGVALPQELLKLENTALVSLQNFKLSNQLMGAFPFSGQSTTYVADAGYKPTLTYTAYDNKGNPLELVKPNGIKVSYKWGYGQQYPIAECQNAANDEFLYLDFEGNGLLNANNSTAHSGEGGYSGTIVLSNYFNASYNGRSYQLSYFSYDGTKWNEVTAPYTGQTITGQLDDVRIYPKDSQMTTYTYKPLIGMTSMTDAKGMTTYYEYDGFGRLKLEKDQYGNVTKNYSYNYKP